MNFCNFFFSLKCPNTLNFALDDANYGELEVEFEIALYVHLRCSFREKLKLHKRRRKTCI